jgi:hypothetical protein
MHSSSRVNERLSTAGKRMAAASYTRLGRLSLANGDQVAIEWIASEFAKAGLKPAFNGSYLQPVPLIEYRADRTQSFVSLKRAAQRRNGSSRKPLAHLRMM